MGGLLADTTLSQSNKTVGVRLALHLNLETQRCDPSYQTLADGVGLVMKRSAIDAIKALEKRGWLAIDRSRGRTSNAFRLVFPSDEKPEREADQSVHEDAPLAGSTVHDDAPLKVHADAPLKSNGAFPCTSTVHDGAPQQCTPMHPNNEENREENIEAEVHLPAVRSPAKNGRRLPVDPNDFEAFIRAYPSKVAVKPARKFYDRIVSKGEATPAEILAGAERYAIACNSRRPEHIANPANWLRDERWRDPPAAYGAPSETNVERVLREWTA